MGRSITDIVIETFSEDLDRPVTVDDRPVEDLGMDSMDMMSISLMLEARLNLPGDFDYDPVAMQTVGDIIHVIEERYGAIANGAGLD